MSSTEDTAGSSSRTVEVIDIRALIGEYSDSDSEDDHNDGGGADGGADDATARGSPISHAPTSRSSASSLSHSSDARDASSSTTGACFAFVLRALRATQRRRLPFERRWSGLCFSQNDDHDDVGVAGNGDVGPFGNRRCDGDARWRRRQRRVGGDQECGNVERVARVQRFAPREQ